MVLTECTGCGRDQWTYYDNLKRGLSRGCQACSQPKAIPHWLDRRLTAAKQRCENPNAPHFHNYGGRGIQFNFPSVTEAGLWILENLGIPDRSLEIDRIDNNGHYEPGNLRFTTRKKNAANRRCVRIPEWDPSEWPYARAVVLRKMAAGMTREEIFEDARKAVREKRKNWRGIAAKLESMTS